MKRKPSTAQQFQSFDESFELGSSKDTKVKFVVKLYSVTFKKTQQSVAKIPQWGSDYSVVIEKGTGIKKKVVVSASPFVKEEFTKDGDCKLHLFTSSGKISAKTTSATIQTDSLAPLSLVFESMLHRADSGPNYFTEKIVKVLIKGKRLKQLNSSSSVSSSGSAKLSQKPSSGLFSSAAVSQLGVLSFPLHEIASKALAEKEGEKEVVFGGTDDSFAGGNELESPPTTFLVENSSFPGSLAVVSINCFFPQEFTTGSTGTSFGTISTANHSVPTTGGNSFKEEGGSFEADPFGDDLFFPKKEGEKEVVFGGRKTSNSVSSWGGEGGRSRQSSDSDAFRNAPVFSSLDLTSKAMVGQNPQSIIDPFEDNAFAHSSNGKASNGWDDSLFADWSASTPLPLGLQKDLEDSTYLPPPPIIIAPFDEFSEKSLANLNLAEEVNRLNAIIADQQDKIQQAADYVNYQENQIQSLSWQLETLQAIPSDLVVANNTIQALETKIKLLSPDIKSRDTLDGETDLHKQLLLAMNFIDNQTQQLNAATSEIQQLKSKEDRNIDELEEKLKQAADFISYQSSLIEQSTVQIEYLNSQQQKGLPEGNSELEEKLQQAAIFIKYQTELVESSSAEIAQLKMELKTQLSTIEQLNFQLAQPISDSILSCASPLPNVDAFTNQFLDNNLPLRDAQLEKSYLEIEVLQSKLKQSEQQLYQHENKSEGLIVEINSLNLQIISLNDQLILNNNIINELRSSSDDIRTKFDEKNQQCEVLQVSIAKSNASIARLESQIDTIQSENAELNNKLLEAANYISYQTEQLDISVVQIDQLKANLQVNEDYSKKQNLHLDELKKELELSNSATSTLEMKFQLLKEDNIGSIQKSLLESYSSEIDFLKSQVIQKDDIISLLNSEVEELNNKLKSGITDFENYKIVETEKTKLTELDIQKLRLINDELTFNLNNKELCCNDSEIKLEEKKQELNSFKNSFEAKLDIELEKLVKFSHSLQSLKILPDFVEASQGSSIQRLENVVIYISTFHNSLSEMRSQIEKNQMLYLDKIESLESKLLEIETLYNLQIKDIAMKDEVIARYEEFAKSKDDDDGNNYFGSISGPMSMSMSTIYPDSYNKANEIPDMASICIVEKIDDRTEIISNLQFQLSEKEKIINDSLQSNEKILATSNQTKFSFQNKLLVLKNLFSEFLECFKSLHFFKEIQLEIENTISTVNQSDAEENEITSSISSLLNLIRSCYKKYISVDEENVNQLNIAIAEKESECDKLIEQLIDTKMKLALASNDLDEEKSKVLQLRKLLNQ